MFVRGCTPTHQYLQHVCKNSLQKQMWKPYENNVWKQTKQTNIQQNVWIFLDRKNQGCNDSDSDSNSVFVWHPWAENNQKSMGSMNNPAHVHGHTPEVRGRRPSATRQEDACPVSLPDSFISLRRGADGKYVSRCQQAAFKVTLAARHFNMGRKFTSPVWGLTLSAADTRLEQQSRREHWAFGTVLCAH